MDENNLSSLCLNLPPILVIKVMQVIASMLTCIYCVTIISTEDYNDSLAKAYNSIRNEYSSILKEWGLSINSGKCRLKRVSELNDELKKSLCIYRSQ